MTVQSKNGQFNYFRETWSATAGTNGLPALAQHARAPWKLGRPSFPSGT